MVESVLPISAEVMRLWPNDIAFTSEVPKGSES